MKFKKISGVKVYAPTSRKELINYALESKSILVAINAEKILNATDTMRDLINRNLGYPDGVGAVWALEKKGCKNVIKIAGCELWLDIIKQHYHDKTFYLVGGKEEVIHKTVAKLKEDYPGINIVNYRNGYIKSEKEKQELIDDVAEKKPSVIFIAMGSPKQELLMEELQQHHQALYQGLGGSFDVYTGFVERAPSWWIDNNLEWAYRLIKQPTRIKRQLVYLEFFAKLKLNKL